MTKDTQKETQNDPSCFGALKHETEVIKQLLPAIQFTDGEHHEVIIRSQRLIEHIKNDNNFSIEEFIYRFSLSSDEGIAVICLAEGLLRIPDTDNSMKLAIDKLSDKRWYLYVFKRFKSFKSLFASIGLCLSGAFTDIADLDNILSKMLKKMGQGAFVSTVKAAVQLLSGEFVFAEDIIKGLQKTKKLPQYKFAFDILGESARTEAQADHYYAQYQRAIKAISEHCASSNQENLDLYERPNISVKLTALYPRFELAKLSDLNDILYPKLLSLVQSIQENNLTITFDAEEAFRFDAYILLLSKLLQDKSLKDFNGIGLVVQAYQTRSYQLIEYIAGLAKKMHKIIPIRLVKGAYWDNEIKHAQELGMKYYPVFTKKDYTDANYIACARLMLQNDKYIFSQFATHNAHTVSCIIQLGQGKKYEFQKLFGMGNCLHKELLKEYNVRIYAPVGKSNDLLAYLMRRMLENAASSSFVHKVHDPTIKWSDLAYNLYDKVLAILDQESKIVLPEDIFKRRKNGMGYDLGYKTDFDYIHNKVSSYFTKVHKTSSIVNGRNTSYAKNAKESCCPGKFAEKFSTISYATQEDIDSALTSATKAFDKWSKKPVSERAAILEKIADLFEKNKFELYAILIKEAGKYINDAINEVIEAIDFCRYYAIESQSIMEDRILPGPTGERNKLTMHGRGVFLCISPWNFPLAIFTGQIVAALVSGNAVIAKPACQTTVIANYIIKLMHKAGVPKDILHLILAPGSQVGKYLVPDERIDGIAFTGSTATAKKINMTLAERDSGIVPIIAETGGQNAMIVDSSALLEQVTDDVLMSSFYSAGQRCSALRVLYIQEEIYDELLTMIKDAASLLVISDPIDFKTDIGPVIDKIAFDNLSKYIDEMHKKGFKIYHHPQKESVKDGYYFYPHIIEINSINDVPDEKFGPILHVVKYKTKKLDSVINEINGYGFGLTFGIHSRIEDKIDDIKSKIKVGNIYVNRSIIGAKVESQPFGGEKKSGTGFKAGGPHYLLKFMLERTTSTNLTAIGGNVELLKEM